MSIPNSGSVSSGFGDAVAAAAAAGGRDAVSVMQSFSSLWLSDSGESSESNACQSGESQDDH